MKIGIDARFWGIEHTGIGRYLMALVRNLEKIDTDHEFVIFLRKKHFNKLKFTNPRFRKVLADFPHYSLAEQTVFKRVLEKEKLDLVHFPHFNLPIFYTRQFVVTIHDLIKHESKGLPTTTHPRLFYWFKYLAYLLVINIALRRAKAIIVPSRWWKRRLKEKFGLSKKKVKVTYEAVSESFKRLASASDKRLVARTLKKHEIKPPFVVYTGNLYPHKNVPRLVEAIAQINEQRKLFLVIVCAKSIFWQRLKKAVEKAGASQQVILAGFVSDRELICLYQAAEAFVFPSLLEGFGLPGLEAMAVGLPVVSSRASCLPEIYQEAAHYFNPRSIRDMKRKILAVLDEQRLKKKLIRRGYRRVGDFSWRKMAEETLAIYQSQLE